MSINFKKMKYLYLKQLYFNQELIKFECMKKIADNLKEKEEDPFITILKAYQIEVTKSKAASKKFLVDIGVMTKKGNLKKNYRALCTLKEQE